MLANNPKFELLFQPARHPWVNTIERLQKTLHDTVTRHHQHGSMNALMGAVRRFMEVCQPWPHNAHAQAGTWAERICDEPFGGQFGGRSCVS